MADRTGSTRITAIDGVAPTGATDWLVSVNGDSAGVVVEPADLLGPDRFQRLMELLSLSDGDEVVIRLSDDERHAA